MGVSLIKPIINRWMWFQLNLSKVECISITTLVFRFSNNSMCTVGMVRCVDFLTAISVCVVHIRAVFIVSPFAGRNRDLGGLPVRIYRGREPTDSAAGGKKNAEI